MPNGQDDSPFSSSGLSGSGLHHDSGSHELPDPKLVFSDFFNGLLVFNVVKPEIYLERFTPSRVLEALKADRERVADIVSNTTGMRRSIVLSRYDLARYAEDIEAGMKEEPEIAKIFLDQIGVDFFLEHMPLQEHYEIGMGAGWMLKDSPRHRGLAASLCNSLAKHNAFGSPVRTLEYIKSAISIDTLMSDAMPHVLKTRIVEAMCRGAKKYGGKHLAEYMFDKAFGGVSFVEMAEHLPVEPLARPFAAYVDMLKLVETQIERPSELPPSDHPAVQIEGAASPDRPLVPKPPPFVPPLPALTDGAPPPVYGPKPPNTEEVPASPETDEEPSSDY